MKKKVTVLIPRPRPPDSQEIIITEIRNILDKLKEKYDLKIIWVLFQPKKIEKSTYEDIEILDFQNFDNAIEILEKTKPDLILIQGTLEFSNVAFAMGGKFLKIPIVTLFSFFVTFFHSDTFWLAVKNRLNQIFSKNVMGEVSNDAKPEKLKSLKFIFKKFTFLINTYQKITSNKIKLMKFSLLYSIKRMSKHIPIQNLVDGDLNVCYVPEMAEKLIQSGFNKSNIVVTGNPGFDKLFNEIKTRKIEIPPSNEKIKILFCPAPLHEHGICSKKEEDELIINVLNKILKNDDFEVALKIHPSSSSKKEYLQLIKKISNPVLLFQKENLIDLLRKYDVMLTYGGSTVTLYGVLFRRPVVFLDYFSKNNKFRIFLDEKILTVCRNPDEIVTKIKESRSNFINENGLKDYTKRHIGTFDGRSSERITKFILKLLETN